MKNQIFKFVLLQLSCLTLTLALPISVLATRTCADVLKTSQNGSGGKITGNTEHILSLARSISKYKRLSIPPDFKLLQLELFADELLEVKKNFERPDAVADENIRQIAELLNHKDLSQYLIDTYILGGRSSMLIKRVMHRLMSISFLYLGRYPRNTYFYTYLSERNNELKGGEFVETRLSNIFHPLVFSDGLFIDRAQFLFGAALSDPGGRLEHLNELAYKRLLPAPMALSILQKTVLRSNPLPLTKLEITTLIGTMGFYPARWSNPLELLGFELVDLQEMPESKIDGKTLAITRGEFHLKGRSGFRVTVNASEYFVAGGQQGKPRQSGFLGLDLLLEALLNDRDVARIEIQSLAATSLD